MAIYNGTAGNDSLTDAGAPLANDVLNGNAGNDTLEVTGGIDEIRGHYPSWYPGDPPYIDSADDLARILWGHVTDDVTLEIFAFNPDYDTGVAEAGDGSAHRVTLNRIEHVEITTGSGDDALAGVANKWDKFDGGAGTDRWSDIFTMSATALDVDMREISTAAGQTLSDGTVVKNIEAAGAIGTGDHRFLMLSGHDDTFRDFGDHDDRVDGQGGNDLFVHSGGQDFYKGASGEDTLRLLWGGESLNISVMAEELNPYAVVGSSGKGGVSTHQVDFNGIEHLDVRAGSGNDILHGNDGSWDKFNGGAGVDLWKDALWNLNGVTVNMAKAATGKGLKLSDGTVVKNVERAILQMSDGKDTFIDTGRRVDKVEGGHGADSFASHGGRDVFDGGNGVDLIKLEWQGFGKEIEVDLGAGKAWVETGNSWANSAHRVALTSVERVIAKLGSKADEAEGGGRADTLIGNGGADRLDGKGGNDVLRGGTGNDRLFGRLGNDTLRGDGGNDVLRGEGGNDRLYGGAGADILIGGKGRDFLRGDAGRDQLTGGAGADTFVLRKGAGLDRIRDFDDGVDQFGIEGLKAVQLRFVDKGSWTLIETRAGEDLARVDGIDPDDLSGADFFLL